ncbi:M23 family metallopeptidase [Jiangella muralis]|uniref:M23 family metallopeptidase n=1 Tax=Jiangella muralis TaxID=702383 RepID=UPI00069CD34A|nr:M23 family metallopeptidase [Jiangella muralis]
MKKIVVALALLVLLTGPAVILQGMAVILNPAAQAACLPTSGGTGEVPDSLTAATADGDTITLNRTQLGHAATIITIGTQTPDVGQRGTLVALVGALTESDLRQLANTSAYPESAEYPNDGDGSDHDSLGLFQMRPTAGWGSVAELMDPAYQVAAFYGGPTGPNRGSPRGLLDIPGWQQLTLGEAAQAVEVSAFPDRYQNFEPVAYTIYARLAIGSPPLPTDPSNVAGQVVLPLPAGTFTITDRYGVRVHPITGVRSMHWGTDYAAPAGTPLLAVADGVVAEVRQDPVNGNVVLVDHFVDGTPTASMYGHMTTDGVHVAVGDTVAAGQQIGTVGSAGLATGPHLHLEIRPGGSAAPQSAAVDPEEWLADHNAAPLDTPTAVTPACGGQTVPDIGELPPSPEPFTGQPGGHVDDPTGTGGFVTRPTAHLISQAQTAFPGTGWACWDPHPQNPTSDHPVGKACDITFGNQLGTWPTPAQAAEGWRVVAWLRTYASQLHVKYLIFDGKIWTRGDADWRPYTSSIYDVSTPTGSHADHIHVSTLD